MAFWFEGFTEEARQILTKAQEESVRLQCMYIGTEHILWAMVDMSGSMAAKILEENDLNLAKVKDVIKYAYGKNLQVGSAREIGMTPRAKRVIELAVDEARRRNENLVGGEHLLLGLLREGESATAGILESFGLTLEKTRIGVDKIMGVKSTRVMSNLSLLPYAENAVNLAGIEGAILALPQGKQRVVLELFNQILEAFKNFGREKL